MLIVMIADDMEAFLVAWQCGFEVAAHAIDITYAVTLVSKRSVAEPALGKVSKATVNAVEKMQRK